MKAVCSHEIGHALGIVGHSLDRNDVMFKEDVEDNGKFEHASELSADDKRTIELLYSNAHPFIPSPDWKRPAVR
jgi:predicted Zn-dependent protease